MAKVTVQKIERAPDVAIVLVLQWLAYALWGMFVASLMWLAGVVFASAIIESSRPASGDLLAFSLSATLVSLLLASLADYWYSRYEPALKVGVARVVMLVHVVLFTLAGVALAIAISYNLLSSLVGASGGVIWSNIIFQNLAGGGAFLSLYHYCVFYGTWNSAKHSKFTGFNFFICQLSLLQC